MQAEGAVRHGFNDRLIAVLGCLFVLLTPCRPDPTDRHLDTDSSHDRASDDGAPS
jgi:hypothetical protein